MIHHTLRFALPLSLSLLFTLGLTGCDGAKKDGAGDQAHQGHEHEGHDHDAHGHSDVGPHGGHLLELEPEGLHAEWLHDDEGSVVIYLLDADAKTDAPTAKASVSIDVTIKQENAAEQTTMNYQVEPVYHAPANLTDEPKTAEFLIVDKQLVQSLLIAGEGVEAVLTIVVDDKTYRGRFEHHEHEGHEH